MIGCLSLALILMSKDTLRWNWLEYGNYASLKEYLMLFNAVSQLNVIEMIH